MVFHYLSYLATEHFGYSFIQVPLQLHTRARQACRKPVNAVPAILSSLREKATLLKDVIQNVFFACVATVLHTKCFLSKTVENIYLVSSSLTKRLSSFVMP